MLSDYKERQAEKIERFNDLAIKNAIKSEQLSKQASDLLSVIPPGQPILVGHHSEKGHRKLLERTDNMMRKAIKTEEKAKYYEHKADLAENGTAISSDNPDALDELREKLRNLKDSHALMIEGNKIIRDKKLTADQKVDALIKIGLPIDRAKAKLKPDVMGDTGFPRYAITNSSANIRNVEKRIEYLEKQRNDKTREWLIGNIRIVDSVEDNRVMIFFPGIPDEGIRHKLKSSGFRWSPSNKAWQAYRTAAWHIPYIIRALTAMPGYVSPVDYFHDLCGGRDCDTCEIGGCNHGVEVR